MDHKDFKRTIAQKLKEQLSFGTWLKTAKERASRPRITRNILMENTHNETDSKT
jgi:hypothetical protein